jgi:hypothetical protein
MIDCLNSVVLAAKCQIVAIWALTLVVFTTGCERAVGPGTPAPTTLVRAAISRYEWKASNEAAPIYFKCPVKIVRTDGTQVILESNQTAVEIDVPENQDLRSKFLTENLEVLGPDAWVKISGLGEIDYRQDNVLTLAVSCPGEVMIFFDNRTNPSGELTIGQLKFPLPANGAGAFRFPGPSASEGAVVRLGGEQIGTIDPLDAAKKRTYLVDTTGHRAYRYREVFYGPGLQNERHRYSERHFHIIPGDVFYFLCPAPDSIKSAFAVFERGELVDD